MWRALRAIAVWGCVASGGCTLPPSGLDHGNDNGNSNVNTNVHGSLVTMDRFVAHTSTVPANAGEPVELFLREKLHVETLARIEGGSPPTGRVVLFLHGASIPSAADFDVPYQDYSWMAALAEAGFDAFSVDLTGFGFSPRPEMADPCNLLPEDQALLTPNPLAGPCDPSYPFRLTTSDSDLDEIDTAVEHIRALRGVARVHLVAWSGGGPRAMGYAARHPGKVERVVLFAPGYWAEAPTDPGTVLPQAGVPMRIQTQQSLMEDRWQSAVRCADQVDPGIRDVLWETIQGFDPLGATWGPPGGVMRVRQINMPYGFNQDAAATVTAPTLILVGADDDILGESESLYDHLTGVPARVLVTLECASHFAVWETFHHQLIHQASVEWLTLGTFQGLSQGQRAIGVGATR